MISREQAALLADLARTIRPAWDTRPITAALAQVRDRELPDIAAALIRCAQNPDMRTPAALSFDANWHTSSALHLPAHRRDTTVAADPENVRRWAAAARANLAAAREKAA